MAVLFMSFPGRNSRTSRTRWVCNEVSQLDNSTFFPFFVPPNDYSPYQFLTVFLVIAILFPIAPLLLARLWARCYSPAKPGPQKNSIYECGLEAKGEAHIRFRSEYYLYAILFLIFDVETVFLFPFAVAFTGLPIGALVAMAIFVLLLIEGLAWAWVKGVLTWR